MKEKKVILIRESEQIKTVGLALISFQKRMFITKQPKKSKIIENPQYKNKAIQLSLMQRNKLIKEEDVGKTHRVIQTDSTNIERDLDKADRVIQTDPKKN